MRWSDIALAGGTDNVICSNTYTIDAMSGVGGWLCAKGILGEE